MKQSPSSRPKYARELVTPTTRSAVWSLFVILFWGISMVQAQSLNVMSGAAIHIASGSAMSVDHLSVQSGGTVVLNSSSELTLSSDLTNSGSLVAYAGSTVDFTGSAMQFLSGFTTFSNLTKSGGGSLILNSDILVNGNLTLNSGTIQLGSNSLGLGIPGSITGGSASSYIVTDGTGALIRGSVGTTPALFPVGTATSYNPAVLQTGTGTDDFSVRVISSVSPPSPDDPSAVQRTWDIQERTPGGNGNITLKLQWNSPDEGASFNRLDATSWRHNGTAWAEEGLLAGVTGTDPYVATIEQVTNSGRYTIANPGALPIQLLSFAATVTVQGVLLEWTTLTEINNYGFFVQRRLGSDSLFADIPNSFVPGHGTTQEPHHYSYLDSSLTASGTYLYRLRQIDLGGAVHFTESISVGYIVSDVPEAQETLPTEFRVYQNYPNPFNPSTTIAYDLPANAYVSLKLYDLLGREVMTVVDGFEPAGRKSVTVDATSLASGAYFYRLVAGNMTETRKLLLLR